MTGGRETWDGRDPCGDPACQFQNERHPTPYCEAKLPVWTASQERARVVAEARRWVSTICGVCEWDNAQRIALQTFATAIERGDHTGGKE